MTWFWLVVSFVAGWYACWVASKMALKHVMRQETDLAKDAVKGLSQRSLLKLHNTVMTELELRKRGLDEAS